MKFLFTADWHLRPDKPRCRLDTDWVETQNKHLTFVADKALEFDVPVVVGGDIFHRPQVPDTFKTMFQTIFRPIQIYIMAGQHDEPYHSFANIAASSFGVLLSSGGTVDLGYLGKYAHFGEPFVGNDTGLYFTHELIFKDKKSLPPFIDAYIAQDMLDKYPEAKWIFSGDNHHGFHYEKDGRHVLMAGCLNRQAADTIDYEPKIWLVDTEKGTAEPIPVPDDVQMVTDEYIVRANESEDRIQAFVESIKTAGTIELDYIENIEKGILQNSLSKRVENMIRTLIAESQKGESHGS